MVRTISYHGLELFGASSDTDAFLFFGLAHWLLRISVLGTTALNYSCLFTYYSLPWGVKIIEER